MAQQPESIVPPVRDDGLPLATSDSMTAGGDAADDMPDRSLLGDIEAAWQDGKTYVAAELAFQKTRARFSTAKLKSVVIYGVAAVFLAVLALIGLTVGAILSLATLIGPLAATLIVVAMLLLVAFVLVKRASSNWSALSGAFSSEETRS
ncbi:phage holin family protein [Croceibacterium mercuriale]|uniref:phage holin family protein n=1 Tax=Croceibacterium mercuriale TaxID=1572751 RepID=UPI0006914571|nr:phage holin family protein [Croceibacterium mercuriale]